MREIIEQLIKSTLEEREKAQGILQQIDDDLAALRNMCEKVKYSRENCPNCGGKGIIIYSARYSNDTAKITEQCKECE